jgi:hypothetical protein
VLVGFAIRDIPITKEEAAVLEGKDITPSSNRE